MSLAGATAGARSRWMAILASTWGAGEVAVSASNEEAGTGSRLVRGCLAQCDRFKQRMHGRQEQGGSAGSLCVIWCDMLAHRTLLGQRLLQPRPTGGR